MHALVDVGVLGLELCQQLVDAFVGCGDGAGPGQSVDLKDGELVLNFWVGGSESAEGGNKVGRSCGVSSVGCGQRYS